MGAESFEQLIQRFGRRYDTGAVVFYEGEAGSEIFFVTQGRVSVTTAPQLGGSATEGGYELCKLGAGDIFGDLALLDDLPRSATVTAIEPLEVIVFDRDNLFDHLSWYPELAVRLLKLLAQRMRRMDAQTKALLGHQEYNLLESRQQTQLDDPA